MKKISEICIALGYFLASYICALIANYIWQYLYALDSMLHIHTMWLLLPLMFITFFSLVLFVFPAVMIMRKLTE